MKKSPTGLPRPNHTRAPLTTGLALCLALGLPKGAFAEVLIDEFKGGRSTTTPEFEVQAPWILDWRTTGDSSTVTGVDVSLFDAATGEHLGSALRQKTASNGVRMFDQSGRFYFRVDATLLEWNLKVIQLTDEEAKTYTPKTNHLLDNS